MGRKLAAAFGVLGLLTLVNCGGNPASPPSICSGSLSFSTGQPATTVIGQTDFISQALGTTASAMKTPGGSAFSTLGLFIADYGNNRVLGFSPVPTSNGSAASVVVGQSSFTAASSGTDLYQMGSPAGIQVLGSQLLVTDQANARVLIWNALPAASGTEAGFAFPSGRTGCGRNMMVNPKMSFTNGNKLVVSDTGNNRVLIYNSFPQNSSAIPDLVLGQSDFDSCSSRAASSTSITGPSGIWTDGSLLAVTDKDHNRVLIWKTFPTSNNQAADIVLGQPDFSSSSSALDAKSLSSPVGLYSNCHQLFVADSFNRRVLVWNSIPTSSYSAADVVLGQTSFTTSATPFSGTIMDFPVYISADDSRIAVSESGTYRVLLFNGR